MLADRRTRAASAAGKPDGVGVVELFLLFSQLGLSSFGGGVSAWMHRAFVARRGWLEEAEFSAVLALARIMPGVNVINLAVLIGQRLRGSRGAAAAALGLLVGPSLVAIGLTMVYDALAGSVVFHAAIEGAAASAAGLLIAMGVSSVTQVARGNNHRPDWTAAASGAPTQCIATPPHRHTLHRAAAWLARGWQSLAAVAVLLSVFVLIGLLRLPTVPVVLCLAPLSIALAFLAPRPTVTERRDGR